MISRKGKKTGSSEIGLVAGLCRAPVGLAVVAATLLMASCGIGLDDQALVERAKVAAAEHDLRSATIDLKSVLQRDPENADARLALGRIYLLAAEPFAAEKELRRAAEYGTPRDQIIVPLGEALLGQGAFDMVLAEVREDGVENDAARVSIKLLRGDAELALGRQAKAGRLYVEVLELDSVNPVAYLGLASIAIAEDQLEQSAVYLDRAVELAPDMPAVWLARGEFYLSRRLLQPARSDFERALELTGDMNSISAMESVLSGLTDIDLIEGDFLAATQNVAKLKSVSPNSIAERYAAARVAFATGDTDEAVVLLQGILKDSPDFRQAHLLYGAVSRARGNLAQAEMYLASVVSFWPDNEQARRLLADVRLRQQKPADAAAALEPLLEKDYVDDEVLAAAGLVKLQMGDANAGLEYFRRSVEVDPSNAIRKMDLATLYLAVGQIDPAIEILESLRGNEVDSDRLDVLNVVSIHRSGELAKAIETAERYLKRSPENIALLIVAGGLYQDAGNLAVARIRFDQVLRLDSDNVGALLRIGRIDVAEGQIVAAKSRYRRAQQSATGRVPAMIELARVAIAQGDTATAVSWLEKARSASSKALMPRFYLATHYLKQQRIKDAILVAEEAVQIDERNAQAHNILGVTRMAAGEFAEASQSFTKALQRNSDVAAYRLNLARAESKRGNSGEALKLVRENFSKHPDHVPTATNLAADLLRIGRHSEALDIAYRLQETQSNKAAGLALQGEIFAAQSKPEEAARLYDQALAIRQNQKLAVRAFQLRMGASLPSPFQPIIDYLNHNPSDSAARMLLAEVYLTNGENNSAATQYELLLDENPDNVVALNNLAWILVEVDDPRAKEIAEKAYRILPENAAIADTFGYILLKQGEPMKAAEILKAAAEAAPENSNINKHLEAALLASGEDT